MQAVILAAGKGTRMGDLTKETPKPMLKVGGKNLLELKLEILPESVEEVIFIVGYFNEKIRAFFGDEYLGRKIRYVEQANPTGGTADALWSAKDILKDRFIVMMGDDLYSKEDIDACIKYEWAELIDKVQGKRGGGKIIFDEKNILQDIVEGEHDETEWWANTNMWVLDTRLFSQAPVPKAKDSTEVGLPQTILVASKAQNIPITTVPASFWFQITAPEDLTEAEKALAHKVAQE